MSSERKCNAQRKIKFVTDVCDVFDFNRVFILRNFGAENSGVNSDVEMRKLVWNENAMRRERYIYCRCL